MDWLRAGASRREFERFVTDRTGPLLRTAHLVAGNLAEAEDLVQETLLRVARRWPKVRAMEHPAAYARKILIIDTRRSVVLPEGADVVKIAAAMNPAMSAWVALRHRVPIEAGQSVLVLGATGNAGQMAIQVARRLGAGRVVGAGRDQARPATLPGIGADTTVALTRDADATAAALADAASEVDLVIDYLWGKPATDTIMALLRARADRSRALNWIQIGSVAGPDIQLPSVALRSANFRLQGTGQGAVSTSGYLAELPSLIDEIDNGHIAVTARPAPLSDVETVWKEPAVPGVRTVLVPVAPGGHADGLSK